LFITPTVLVFSFMPSLPQQSSHKTKQPHSILTKTTSTEENSLNLRANSIFAFPPNRDTLGATSYFILNNEGNILVDCPALEQINRDFLSLHGGVRWFFISHRGAIGKAAEYQQSLNCEILIQEQEAYLLPGLTLTTFTDELTVNNTTQIIWTPGHSPGSSCLYYREFGGVLFSGRHLLPNQQGEPTPLRTSKTFHWPRQLKSVQSLSDRFTPDNLTYLCPGANTGYLRGKPCIDQAYQKITNLNLSTLGNGEGNSSH
jgi:glyoxylase-like metal-dependent hydrolase (beta-lactamase superfamily II)